ncbi:hypothetical protein DIPPA_24488 [Diplonema papillatum]|nr:hypothetical protein DIPPA_24488 [Diplonema papillatum]
MEAEQSRDGEEEVDALEVLRNTTEYRAAWEVELWKKREQALFKKRLDDEIKRQVSKRLDSLSARATELEEEYKAKARNVKKQEERLARELAETRDQRQLLDECERVLRRRKEDLEREYNLRSREWEDKMRRSREEANHRLSLETLKQKQLVGSVEDLKKKLASSEKKYDSLWADVVAQKTNELKRHPLELIAQAKQEVEDKWRELLSAKMKERDTREGILEARVSALTSANAKLRGKADRADLKLAQSLAQAAELEHVSRALSGDAVHFVRARSDRASAGSDAAPPPLRTGSPVDSPPFPDLAEVAHHLPPALATLQLSKLPPADRQTVLEIARLGKEKERLLGTSCYTEADEVVRALSQQQNKLLRSLVEPP